MQKANKTNACEVFEMPQNPRGIVNVIFACLCLENTRARFHISNSLDVVARPLPPYVPPYTL